MKRKEDKAWVEFLMKMERKEPKEWIVFFSGMKPKERKKWIKVGISEMSPELREEGQRKADKKGCTLTELLEELIIIQAGRLGNGEK